ncbi:MAG: rhomboid family intramembrane serine protease [Chitinophagaceae bacterium]|nr:rhomboid family intramembrane serine protease [Chitinophagaceae bacterium]
MGVLEKTKSRKVFFGEDNDALVRIIIINILVTAILFFVRSVYQLSDIDLLRFQNEVAAWFVLPADAGKLLSRPWTLITFMFSHLDIWNLIANMLWFWAFGFIIQSLYGSRKLAPLYIYGGLGGGIVYVLYSNLVPGGQNMVNAALSGANACIMAIAVAATVAAPKYRIFPMLNGGIPLWVLTIIYAIVSFAGTSYGNAAAYGAEIAGALVGLLFINLLNRGRDPGRWMTSGYDWFFNLFNPDKEPDRESVRQDFFYDTHGAPPFSKQSHLSQQRVDEILDKINQSGYQSLSYEEKDLLRRASEEDI